MEELRIKLSQLPTKLKLELKLSLATLAMRPNSHEAKFVKDEWRKFACDHEWLLDPGWLVSISLCIFIKLIDLLVHSNNWHERRRCSRSPSGGRLATTLVDRYFHHYFFSIFHSPSRPFLIEGVLGSKNLFSESCLKWPHYYREVISDFWFGGSKTRLPSPEGGRQTKSCSDQKTYFAKVDQSTHITIEKWSRIFDLGGLSWPR